MCIIKKMALNTSAEIYTLIFHVYPNPIRQTSHLQRLRPTHISHYRIAVWMTIFLQKWKYTFYKGVTKLLSSSSSSAASWSKNNFFTFEYVRSIYENLWHSKRFSNWYTSLIAFSSVKWWWQDLMLLSLLQHL